MVEHSNWKLANQRHRDPAIRPAVHATAFLQPIQRRRHAQSRSPIAESQFHRPNHPGRPGPLFRPQRVHRAARQHLRQRAAQLFARPRNCRNRSLPGKKVPAHGEIQPPVQSRILQPVQSHQPEQSEPRRPNVGHVRPIADGRRHHLHVHQFPADSVWIKTAVVGKRS